jgi:formate dehydrogenase
LATQKAFTDEPGTDGLHRTYCRLCEAQCGLVAEVADGQIVKVGPDRMHPASQGHLCVKGPAMASITHDPDRVLTPLRRTGEPGCFEPVSWDEALDDIAARLRGVMSRPGDEVALYKGNPASFATLHSAYGAAFLKALGGTKSFSSISIDTGAKNVAQHLVYGGPADWTFPDLEDCDFLVMIGANPMVSHMSLVSEPRALHKLTAIHERGRVVVIDPRRTETAKRFEHLAVLPDSDAWLLAAMLQHIFTAGLEDASLLRAKTRGWEQLRDAVRTITPERAALHCGVEAGMIRDLAERFVRARTSACYGRVGTNRGRYATLVNILIESLNVVAGRFGTSGGWITGISPIADPAAVPTYAPYGRDRSRIGNLPLVLGLQPGGNLAAEITTPGAGQIRALFVDSGNPVLTYPGGDVLTRALGELDLCVALDLYVTETSRHAHYILPATTFFEREDFTDYWVRNAPRPWVQYTPAVIRPRGKARHELAIFDAILDRLGLPAIYADQQNAEVLSPLMGTVDAMLRCGAYGDRFGENAEGLSIERLQREFPSGKQVGERVDAAGSWARVRHAHGRIHLWHEVTAAEFARLLAEPEAATSGQLRLFGRRNLASLNSWMHNVDRLVRSERPTLLVHPDDAAARGLQDGRTVRVTSRWASVEVEAECCDTVVRGSVSYPHGWGHAGGWTLANGLPGANINLLASPHPEDWEQIAGMVHVDGIPVTVEPIAAEAAHP